MDPSEVAQFLSSLSPEEQAVIRPVLERDLEFQRREKQRIRLLKTSVDLIKSDALCRMGSSMRDSLSSESMHSALSGNSGCASSNNSAATSPNIRACTKCESKLGFLFNSGTKCKKCAQLICDSCRIYTTKEKKFWTCPVCFKEREFLAASGEWVNNGEKDASAQVSELLLSQLSRLAMDKRNERRTSDVSQFSRQRAPPMRARNLTLPAIHHNNLLFVPNEDGECVIVTDSSPPDRKRSASPIAGPRPIGANNGYNLMPGMSPREVIGSPAPRAAPTFPISPINSQPPPLPESIPEDGSPTTPPLLPIQTRHRRQSWHTANRIRADLAHIAKKRYATQRYATQRNATQRNATLRNTTQRNTQSYVTLRNATRKATLRNATLRNAKQHAMQRSTLCYAMQRYAILRYATQYYATQRYATLRNTTQRNTQSYAMQRYATRRNVTQHNANQR